MRSAISLLVGVVVLALVGCHTPKKDAPAQGASSMQASDATPSGKGESSSGDAAPGPIADARRYVKPSADALKKTLSPLAYEVTQNDATEPPFQNAFWNNHEAGLYVDATTGEPLFSSKDKFDSGTGWPSFVRPVDAARIVEKKDETHGMVRVEVRSKAGDAHLGHVFDDGPEPTGLRYCINSASLRFIPLAALENEGYGAYVGRVAGPGHTPTPEDTQNSCAPPVASAAPADGAAGCDSKLETAILAGGCFWGMEDILRDVPGVLETEVGYEGGRTKNPTYEDVKKGDTGHAESVRVVFDPAKLSYADLLEKWFFRMHDPTTKNRQGNDRGTQYRSAIFVLDAEQRRVAEAVKKKVNASGKWDDPVVTEIVDAGPFTPAEAYHQDYLEQNPDGYTCHFLRE